MIKVPEIKFTKLFINGEFIDSISGKTFETIDPRTEEVIAKVAEGDKEDVDLAVKAARQAFDHGPWPRLPGSERRRIMLKFADLIEENLEELAALDTIDAANLYSLTKGMHIHNAAELIRYYAGAGDKIHGATLKMSKELHGYTLVEPIGVVGLIIPWNFPTQMFVMKVGPALAAGCTMVVKPAEQTPLSALYYAHLAKQAGVPDGVINVVTGYGSKAGAAISSHMDIDMGQICVAGTRVFVQEGIYDKFIDRLLEELKTWVVGDPFDPNVHQGPQVDKKQYDKVLSYIEHGKREGATLVTGGKALDRKGTVEEVIKRANNTKYGLAAGIMTNDLNIANTLSRSLRAGAIWINCYFAFDNDLPIGGYKMSGFGKDMGMEALNKYLQVKAIATPIFNSPWL
ncbi:hypothetical protein DH2020_035680 [Rehmannia glutinosa]|uniref:Aldehyde dehydrogenase domain-containing protein n=1 Tax=Rehmannia glutinosa TaxID=99300 RepID=A0ABR0V6W6_REHGL